MGKTLYSIDQVWLNNAAFVLFYHHVRRMYFKWTLLMAVLLLEAFSLFICAMTEDLCTLKLVSITSAETEEFVPPSCSTSGERNSRPGGSSLDVVRPQGRARVGVAVEGLKTSRVIHPKPGHICPV